MSIREGYKQTEIGVIPEAWKVDKLENHITIVSGQSPSNFELSGERYKFFKVNQLNFCKKYLQESEYTFDTSNYNNLQIGTIIFPKRGASIFTNKVRILATEGFVDTNLMGLITKKTLDNEYLYYWLISFELSNIADTSSIPQINNKHINPLKLPLPPLPEQQKIAEILSTVDQKIDSIDSKIEETQTLKRGLTQRLLSEGIGHSEFKESEIGRIPAGWEVVELLNLCYDKKRGIVDGPFGSNLKIIHYQSEGIPVIQSNFVTSGKFNAKEYVYVNEEKFNSEIRSKVVGGDIVMAKIGANCGTSAIVPFDHPVSLLSGNSIKISIDPLKASTLFVDFVIKGLYEKTKLVEIKSIGAQPAVSMSILKKMKIINPPLQEQKQIAEILSTADEKLESLRAKKEAFETLKKGLMQKLLSGEVRV